MSYTCVKQGIKFLYTWDNLSTPFCYLRFCPPLSYFYSPLCLYQRFRCEIYFSDWPISESFSELTFLPFFQHKSTDLSRK